MAQQVTGIQRVQTSEFVALNIFYATGTLGTLVIHGLLSERIMAVPFGEPAVYFRDSAFLALCNQAVAVCFAVVMVALKGESYRNAAPMWKYFAASFPSMGSTVCQYEALKYLCLPAQMLCKTFKMVPAMIWGMAMSGKSYGLADWMVALAVTEGIMKFLSAGPIYSFSDPANSSMGLMLMLVFLALDGLNSTFQDKLFKEHVPSKYNHILYINVVQCLVSSFVLVASGRFTEALAFASEHPAFWRDAMALSAAVVGAQWFMHRQLQESGAFAFAATVNVRQVLSILISYAKYGHSISALQVTSLVIIFGALFYRSCSIATGERQPLLPKKQGSGEASTFESGSATKV